MHKNCFEYWLIFLLKQMLHEENERSIPIIIQTFLNESFIIPVGHEVVLRLDKQ